MNSFILVTWYKHLNVGKPASEEAAGAPQDLVTSEVTARSFRVSWTHAPGSVEKYRVVFYPATGGRPEEVTGGSITDSHSHSHSLPCPPCHNLPDLTPLPSTPFWKSVIQSVWINAADQSGWKDVWQYHQGSH